MVLLEQADYQLVKHDGGGYQVTCGDKVELTTFEMRLAIEHFVNCVKEKSAPAATDADNN